MYQTGLTIRLCIQNTPSTIDTQIDSPLKLIWEGVLDSSYYPLLS